MKKFYEASRIDVIVVDRDVIETSSEKLVGGWDDFGDQL